MDTSETFRVMLDSAIASEPEAFKGFDRTKNVQDQLQEMIVLFWIGLHNSGVLKWLSLFSKEFGYDDKSMEQLWLAFLMKELHNKVWTGEWSQSTI